MGNSTFTADIQALAKKSVKLTINYCFQFHFWDFFKYLRSFVRKYSGEYREKFGCAFKEVMYRC